MTCTCGTTWDPATTVSPGEAAGLCVACYDDLALERGLEWWGSDCFDEGEVA